MWEGIAKREHSIVRAFPAPPRDAGAAEYMLFGTVTLLFKTGESKTVDWASHARLKADVETVWKFAYYRVYL